ncbi:MAG: hypothetical protein ACKOC5_08675 [Chloroflexota bacterium]
MDQYPEQLNPFYDDDPEANHRIAQAAWQTRADEDKTRKIATELQEIERKLSRIPLTTYDAAQRVERQRLTRRHEELVRQLRK